MPIISSFSRFLSSVVLPAIFVTGVIAQTPEILVVAEPSKTNVAVFQSEAVPSGVDSGGIQARWLNDTQFRGLTQSFTWPTGAPLAGIGLRISPDQDKRYKFSHPQSYALDVQQLSESRTVLRTLATVQLSLRPELVRPEKYLLITLPAPLALSSGGQYGFHLRPLEPNTHNHIIVSTGGNGKGDRFSAGVANQTGEPGLISAGARYGNAVADFDLTFFLISQAAP